MGYDIDAVEEMSSVLDEMKKLTNNLRTARLVQGTIAFLKCSSIMTDSFHIGARFVMEFTI